MKWDIKEMAFLNMPKINVYKSRPVNSNGLTIFRVERELSIEEKIVIIDQFTDGLASYLIGVIQRWDAEKDSLPKGTYGNIKTVSKKAWIKRNDPRKVLSTNYEPIGYYKVFDTEFREISMVCPKTEYGYSMAFTGEHVVNQWFHALCSELYKREKEYFKSTDKVQLKIKQVRDYGNTYRIYFDNKELFDLIWNGKTDVSEENLDKYIKAYKKLEKAISEIEKTL